MLWKSLLTIAACTLIVPNLYAQGGGGNLGTDKPGDNAMFGGDRGVQVRTPAQQFGDRLKLDTKTQVPAVEQIFADANKEAGLIGQQMLQLRQQLVNLALSNKTDEMKPVVDAYAAAAAKMTGIEAQAFAKIYALLKPNQQANAPQAFAIMAGMFQPAAPRPGGRGGRGGGER